jgi:hypothetical protein
VTADHAIRRLQNLFDRAAFEYRLQNLLDRAERALDRGDIDRAQVLLATCQVTIFD